MSLALTLAGIGGCADFLGGGCDDWRYAEWNDLGLARAAWQANDTTRLEGVQGIRSMDLPSELRITRLETQVDAVRVTLESFDDYPDAVVRLAVLDLHADRRTVENIANSLFVQGAPPEVLSDLHVVDQNEYLQSGWYAVATLPENMTLRSLGLERGAWIHEDVNNDLPDDGHYVWSSGPSTARVEAPVRSWPRGEYQYPRGPTVDSLGRAWYELEDDERLENATAAVRAVFPDATFDGIRVETYAMCV